MNNNELEIPLTSENKKLTFIYERIERWKQSYYQITEHSIFGSVFCLLCITFGSGILALPYTITKIGIILGLLVFVISSLAVLYTIHLLMKTAQTHGILNYSKLINIYYGTNGVLLYEIMNLLANLGSIIVYQQIISNFFLTFLSNFDFFDKLISNYPHSSRFIQMLGFSIFTQIPISQVRNIVVLYKISTLGTIALLYTIMVTIIEFPFYFKENYSFDKVKLFDFNPNIIKITCMYIFAYANHNAILNVVSEVKDQRDENSKKIVNYAFYTEFLVYLIVIVTGYFSTFENTKEIFIDRDEDNLFIIIGKLLYIVALTCHIGLLYYISIPSIELLVNSGQTFSHSGHLLSSSLTILSLTSIAYLFTSISDFISLIGATVDLYLVFIMPILLYINTFGNNILTISLLILSSLLGSAFIIIKLFDLFVPIL